jgi:glucosylceramidase
MECLLGRDRPTCVSQTTTSRPTHHPSSTSLNISNLYNSEGFQWAIYMHNAFTRSSTSGYTHWWCAQNTTGDNALIRLNGDSYQVSARLWAFAGYFRFARPGSVRVDASSDAEDVYVSSFVNENGTVAIPVVNAAHFAQSVKVDLAGLGHLTKGSAYLSDNTHNVSLVDHFELRENGFTAMVEPRSMKTFFLEK